MEGSTLWEFPFDEALYIVSYQKEDIIARINNRVRIQGYMWRVVYNGNVFDIVSFTPFGYQRIKIKGKDNVAG